VGRSVIDNFLSAAQRHNIDLYKKNLLAKQPVGYIIGFSFSEGKNGIIAEAARLRRDGIDIKLVRVDEIVPIARKPTISIEHNVIEIDAQGNRTIEFIANAETNPDHEIVHYSWNFQYDENKGFKADPYIDKGGRFVHKFSAGIFNVAVKVVDSEGMENTEVIKLKVNGGVRRG
jgi:hypothetical protein